MPFYNSAQHKDTRQAPRSLSAKPDEEGKLQGLGAPIADHPVPGSEWTTTVEWDDVDPGAGSGRGVTAHLLGPDHKLGTTVSGDRCGNMHLFPGSYRQAHLLHNELGGPGDDPRNLVAVPNGVNVTLKNDVETKVQDIVNTHHGWIYFRAEATYTNDQSGAGQVVRYANKISCLWRKLAVDQEGLPRPIDGTEVKYSIPISPPSRLDICMGSWDQNPTDDGKAMARASKSPGDLVLTTWRDVKRQFKEQVQVEEKGQKRKRRQSEETERGETEKGHENRDSPEKVREGQDGADHGGAGEEGEKELPRQQKKTRPEIVSEPPLVQVGGVEDLMLALNSLGLHDVDKLAPLAGVDRDLHNMIVAVLKGETRPETLGWTIVGLYAMDPPHFQEVLDKLHECVRGADDRGALFLT